MRIHDRSWPLPLQTGAHRASRVARLLVIGLLGLELVALLGCGPPLRFGDAAQYVRFENQRNEAVLVSYRYDEQTDPAGSLTVGARSAVETTIMIDGGAGVDVQATAAGRVVFDRYYRWSDMPPGQGVLVVAIR
jgi:hypothetical protein